MRICRIFLARFYPAKEKNEIDLIVESDGLLHPVEIKKTATARAKERVFNVNSLFPIKL